MTDAAHLMLFNSLTRELESFKPVHPGEARVYTCGPTVYNYPHIGNMRAYVFADMLGRMLSCKGYKLTHVINITDVGHLTDDADAGEDKLEKDGGRTGAVDLGHRPPLHGGLLGRRARRSTSASRAWSVATDYVAADDRIRARRSRTSIATSSTAGSISTSRPCADYGRLARASTERAKAGSRQSRASATPPTSRSGARPRRARRARWNGIRPGAKARRAGISNAR